MATNRKRTTIIVGAVLVLAIAFVMAFALMPNSTSTASAASYEFTLTEGVSFSQDNVSVQGQSYDGDGIFVRDGYGDHLVISVSGNQAIDNIIATIGCYSNNANAVRGNHGDAPAVSGDGNNNSTYVTINNVNSNTLRISTTGDPVQINHIVVTTTNAAPLTLNINGGNFNGSNSEVYALGKVNTLPTNVTKNGYVFKGWYGNAELTGDPVTAIPANATGAKEFWAKWAPLITYNLFDGTINGDHQTEYVEGVGLTLPTDVTKEGCTFLGWYNNANFTGDPVTAIDADATGGKKFWAKWSCSVTLITNGGTIVSGNVTEYIVSKGATLPTEITNGELVFVGWYDNADFNGNPVTTIGTQEAGARVFWAKWVAHLHNYSTVWSYDETKHWHACTATIGDCDAPIIDEAAHTFADSMDTNAYYACVCGYEDADRKEVFYNTAGTFEIDTNTRQWSYKKQNVTIQVQDLGSNSGAYVDSSKSMTVTVKGNVVIEEITVTVGYVFYGGGDTLASAGSKSGNTFSGINAKTVKVYSNGRMELKHFSVETTPVNGITYELNGGTINEKIDVDYYDYYFDNQGRTLPSDVTRADYTFQGWYDNANFEGDPITAIPTGVTGNKTVWAKWKPTITYNVNGGEIQDAEYATEFTPGVGATLPTTVTKEGYSFGGWWNNATFEGDPVTETGTDVTTPQTYWARWYIVGYYFVGSVTDNKVEEEKLLIKNTAETETDEYYIDVRMSASDTFKVIYGTVVYGGEGRKDTLYPSGTGNEYVVPANGLYRVFFRPNADGGAGWHENVLYAKRLFAEIGTDRYYSLAEAYDAVSANGTIKLLDDVDLTSAAQLVVTQNVTLDLNGYILNITTVANPMVSDFKIVATNGAIITLDDTNVAVGGVKGICYPDAGSYIVLGNCRLDMDAMLVRASVAINHKLEGYVVRDIGEGPDADGFVTIVRPGTDEEIAADVDEWIGFIGEVQATIASKTLINTARSEYEALTAAQKELVARLDTLETAEGAYIALVVETIEALPEVGVLVYEDKAAVENARDLYEALRDEEKDAFSDEALDVLKAAEADMEELKTAKAAEIAIVTLPSPGDLTFADCDDLVRARIRYDALTDYQRSKISEERHTELTAKLETLEEEALICHAAEIVNVQVDALPAPEDIMPWNQSRIESARAAYEALTDGEKAKVAQATVNKLVAAEDALAAVVIDLAAATNVVDVINAIGFVEFTAESYDKIDIARTKYDALTDNQNRFVDNYATLTSAEEKYSQLQNDHDHDATAYAIDLINAIGTVENTPECEGKITKARDAFDALTAGQKEFVTNYETLENAEIAYAAYTPVENVAKIEEHEYVTFLAACEAARTGDVVKLMADIDLTGKVAAYITLRRDITIDLNGHVLDVTSAPLTYIVWASDGAIITIDNTVPERGGVKGILGADYRSGAGIVLHSCRLTLSIAELSKFDAFFSLDVDCVIADLNEGNPSVIGYSSIVYPIGDADYAAAVDGMIDAIGLVEYTDECQALIIAARDAYIALTDDQQLLVNNLATLEAAESNYATLAAAKIEALIADEITVVEKANIDAARAIYDSLNAQEKSYIGATFTKLHDAETTLAAIIAGYVANQEDCKHSLVQISSITGATTYAHDGTMRWYDYRDDEVLDGALGTRVHFPSNSGHNIAPGNVTVNMTAYLYEAREIEIWWKFEKAWCARTDLTITRNTGSTTSRTIRLTQDYSGWNVERVSCPAGVSTITFACSSMYPNTQVGTAGVDFYVIPQSYSMFGDGIICSQCGAVCKHESIGLAFDAETGEYYYVCNETYGCHHKVDLSTIPDEQESSFTSAREAYNALTDEKKALVIPSELLILEKHEAFKSVIENEQVAIQETNAVNNAIALLKKVPEAAEITVNDKTAIQAARTAYNALTEEQKTLIEQTLLDKLTVAEEKYAELKEEEDTQKAGAVTNVITALPAVDDITFENRSLIEQARVAYEMLTSDQKAKITSETRNVLGAAETRGIIVSWEDFFPEDGTYIFVPVTDDTKAMSSNIKIAAYNETTINDNLTNNRNGKWKIVRQGGNVYYAIYSIYDVTYNNNDRLLDAAGWDSSLSDGSKLALVSVNSDKSEYSTDVFRFSKRKGVDMDTDEYYIRMVSTSYNKYNYVITLRSGSGYNIGNYGAKNDYQVWKLIRVNGDEEFAQVVIDLIEPLPTYADTTLADEETIIAVRTAYNGLTAYQQNLVANRSDLFAAEQKIVDIKAANAVDAKITAIGEVTDTPESKALIDTARASYNALTDNQKLLVVGLDTLVAAETTCAGYVTARINALPAVNDIDVDNTTIAAARAKYEALTAEEKSHVTDETMDKLTASESTLSIISLPEIGVADVSVVTTEKLTLANKPAVVAARTQYDALTNEAQALVGGFVDTLVAAETEIADLEAAKEVNDAIVALPAIENLIVDNKAAVDAAVTAYGELSDHQKSKVPVSSVNKLFAEETTVIIMKLPAYDDLTLAHADAVDNADTYFDNLTDDQEALVLDEVKNVLAVADKKIADMTAAKAVSDEIGAIGDVVYDLECKNKIDSARANYNELTGDQKAFLLSDEQNLFEYHYSDLQDKEAEYTAHADEAINNMIDMPVDEITVGDKDDILAARDTYDDLTEEEKQLLPNETVNKLFAAVATIEIIEIYDAEEIHEDISDEEAEAIKNAKDEYDNLTPEQKEMMDEDVVNKVFASATTLEIIELPDFVDIVADDEDAIEAAKNAYEDMTEEQQQMVPGDVVNTLYASTTVLTIVKLPEGADIDEEDEDAIEAARAAYNDLTPEQKEKVPPATVDTLVAAETVLEIVELPAGEEIDEDDTDAISAARTAYDNLTPEQQAKVPQTTVDTLVAAETVLEIAELPEADEIDEDDADAISAARTAYDNLTPEQQAKVPQSTVDTLVAAETTLEIVKLPAVDQIDVTDKDDVLAAKATYDDLSDEQKEKVSQDAVDKVFAADTTIAVLEILSADEIDGYIEDDAVDAIKTAKAKYDDLSDEQKDLLTDDVVNKVLTSATTLAVIEIPVADDIDEDITEDDADAIKAAKAAFDDLTDEQKDMISDVLVNKVFASAATLEIVELNDGEDITTDDADAIAAARVAYNALSDDQKDLVPQTTVDTLVAAEAVLEIVELPVGEEIDEDDEDAISAARTAYDELTPEQKVLVPQATKDTLVAAETTLTIVKLTAAEEITADDTVAIAAARTAYNALSEDQQAKVPQATKDTLIVAETTLTIVKLPAAEDIDEDDTDAIFAAKTVYDNLTEQQKALLPQEEVDKLMTSVITVSIVKLPEAGSIDENISEDNENAIIQAVTAYGALSDEQKAAIPEEIVNKMFASKAALGIVKLSAAEDIDVDDGDAIAAAKNAYEHLTDDQKGLIPQGTVDKLYVSVTTVAIIVIPEADEIGEDITEDDAAAIKAVKAYYDDLTAAQKDLVPEDVANKVCASASAVAIIELPAGEEIDATDRTAIEAARTVYNALTDDQKDLIPPATVDTLVAAETTLTIVELPIAANIVAGDEEAIAAARTAYNALSEDQQAKVPQATKDTLVAAETTLTIVKLPATDEIKVEDEAAILAAQAAYELLSEDQIALLPQETVDKLFASTTIVSIMEIPAATAIADDIVLGDVVAIKAAKAAYDDLTNDQKELVPAYVADKVFASDAALEIIKLPIAKEITVDDKEAIIAAKATYDDLTDKQQPLLPQGTVDKLFASVTTVAILEISEADAIDEDVTQDDAAAIKAAKASYDDLTDDQKALIPEEVTNKVFASVRALAIIELPDAEEIVATDRTAIEAARTAYNALTDDQKDLIPQTTVDTLVAAETTLTIVELPAAIEIVADDRTDIEAAREAYEALTADQKAKVPQTTVDTLVAAETALTIVELPAAIEIVADDRTDIEAAREAYEALTADQKAKVPQTTVDTLVAAETTLTIVELPAAIEIVADDRTDIEAAREAYEALTVDQKAKVPQETVDTLVAAEMTLIIVELPATAETTREDQAAVIAVREAYEALSEEQKAKVPAETLAKLVAAENIYVAMNKIDAIGEVAYTAESKALIDDAKEWFDTLSDDQKAAIDNTEQLQQADTDYNAVDSVFNKIETISDIRYDDRSGDAIGTARQAYVSLTAGQKALLSANSLQKLVDAETVYETLGKIDAIGKVEYSEESKELIDEARTYYNSLSDEQKSLINVVDYATLTESEETYSAKDESAVATYSSLLAIVSVLFAVGLVVLGAMIYLLLKSKKKKGTKTLSVFFFPILLSATHYIDSPFIALYVLAGLLIVLLVAIIILALKNPFLIKEMKKIVKREKEKEEEPVATKNAIVETASAVEEEEEEGGVVVDAKGNYFNIRYNKSFTAKLIQSNDEAKKYYTALKNEILAYKKTKSSVSWAYDSVNAGRSQVVKFAIRGKTLCVYFALNPDDFSGTKFKVEKAEANKYENVPCMYRVKGDRRARYAMELIAITSEKLGLTKGEVPAEDYAMPYETTEALLEKGLIKELKIAATEAQIQRAKAAGAIQVVSHVSVQEADEMITDEVAATLIGGRAGGATGKKTIVNVDVLSKNYSDGDTVTIEDLKEKKLVPQSTKQVKLLARGVLDKKLQVELQDYSIEAVKMILATGGTVKRV